MFALDLRIGCCCFCSLAVAFFLQGYIKLYHKNKILILTLEMLLSGHFTTSFQIIILFYLLSLGHTLLSTQRISIHQSSWLHSDFHIHYHHLPHILLLGHLHPSTLRVYVYVSSVSYQRSVSSYFFAADFLV